MLQKISHAAADAAIQEHLLLQTPIQKKTGSNNRFPLKESSFGGQGQGT